MSQTSLKYWIHRRLAWLLVAVMVFGTISSLSLIDWLFDRFEYQSTQDELGRAAALLSRDSEAFATITADYGLWDDSSAFLAGQKNDYWLHFTPELIQNSHWGWVLIRDRQLKPVSSITLSNGKTTTLTDTTRARLIQGLPARCDRQMSQVGWLAGQPFLFAQAPITESIEAPAQGCIVFGRWLDARYLQQIASLSGGNIRIATLGQSRYLAQDQTVASLDVPALNVRLYTETRQTLVSQRWMTALLILGNMMLLTLIVLLALGHLIQRKIIYRLEYFVKLADRYLLTGDNLTRWPVQDHDEIDRLGNALNTLVAEIEDQIHSIAYDADHDALTGIGNRRFLLRHLQGAVLALEQDNSAAACLLLIDLDGFKLINDHLGHVLGDTVLCEVARRLTSVLRPDDQVVRLGGDEFAIWLPATDSLNARRIAEQLCVEVARPLPQRDAGATLTASIGLASLQHGLSPTALLRNADLAMYEAKRRGKNQVVLFDQAIHQAFTRRAELEAALRLALERQQIEAWFQPIVDAQSQQIRSLEALARWRLDGVYVSPIEFIPIAEEAGLIGELGRQMLLASCAMLRRLHDLGWSLSCSVNVSIRQFSDGDLGADIMSLLQAHQLAPGLLHLEVTESLIAQRELEFSATLNQLSALGLHLHLDDFGTGYSSLSRLQQLPLHALKIDRSFINSLTEDHTVMVHTIVEMARSLGLQVIAEGVETLDQYQLLCQLEVDLIQGYLFAKPMPEAELRDWLAQYRPLS